MDTSITKIYHKKTKFCKYRVELYFRKYTVCIFNVKLIKDGTLT